MGIATLLVCILWRQRCFADDRRPVSLPSVSVSFSKNTQENSSDGRFSALGEGRKKGRGQRKRGKEEGKKRGKRKRKGEGFSVIFLYSSHWKERKKSHLGGSDQVRSSGKKRNNIITTNKEA